MVVSPPKTDRINGNGLKAYQGKFRQDIGKNFFTEVVVRHHRMLHREVVELASQGMFKKACRRGTWHVI